MPIQPVRFQPLWLLPITLLPLFPIAAVAQAPGLDSRINMTSKGITLAQNLSPRSRQVSVIVDSDSTVPSTEFRFKQTVKEALDTLADHFDYRYRVNSHGIALFTRKFTKPENRPQIPRDEWKSSFQNAASLLGFVEDDSSDKKWGLAILDLWGSLTPGQKATLESGVRLLPADLSPDQHARVARAVNLCAFGTLKGLFVNMAGLLDNPESINLVVQKSTKEDPLRESVDLHATSRQGDQIVVNLGSRKRAEGPVFEQPPLPPDPVDSVVEVKVSRAENPLDSLLDMERENQPLDRLFAEIARASGFKVKLVGGLKERRASVLFHQRSIRALLDGLCEMYDYEWVSTGNSSATLQAKSVRVQDYPSLAGALRANFPRDLRDYLGLPDPMKRFDYNNPVFSAHHEIASRAKEKMMQSLSEGRLRDRNKIGWTDLNRAQQDALILHLLSSTYFQIGGDGYLKLEAGVANIDPKRAELLLKPDGTLSIGVNFGRDDLATIGMVVKPK